MFNPSRDEVRSFFTEAWSKSRGGGILTPIETIAVDWIGEHSEYHAALQAGETDTEYSVESGQTNPFLHLSMHMSITEQVSIDQPRGIRESVEQLARKHGSMHDAHHIVMECLGQMLWTSQRSGQPPDGEAYVDCVRRRASAG